MGNCRYNFKISSSVAWVVARIFLKRQTTRKNKKEEEDNGNQKRSRTGGLLGKFHEGP